MLNDSKIAAYTAILQEELLLATGCTEPIAVAYCAAKLREVLGGKPEKILAEISGNILKNVKSVVVPNTGGRRGIDAAIAVGIVAGDADAELQVIANVTEAVPPPAAARSAAADPPAYCISAANCKFVFSSFFLLAL